MWNDAVRRNASSIVLIDAFPMRCHYMRHKGSLLRRRSCFSNHTPQCQTLLMISSTRPPSSPFPTHLCANERSKLATNAESGRPRCALYTALFRPALTALVLQCSGEKPVCKRCTTRGLICQYSVREPRPRGTAHALRNSVSSIELRGENHAQAYQLHRERQKEQDYYQIFRQNSANVIPYELASQAPPNHYLRTQPHLMGPHHMPFQSQSQASSLPGSPYLVHRWFAI